MLFREMLQEEREEGIAEGEAIGIVKNQIQLILKKKAKGISEPEIAELLELDPSFAEDIFSLIRRNPNVSSGDLARLILNKETTKEK